MMNDNLSPQQFGHNAGVSTIDFGNGMKSAIDWYARPAAPQTRKPVQAAEKKIAKSPTSTVDFGNGMTSTIDWYARG